MSAEHRHDYGYINDHLSQLCARASAVASDLLEPLGELSEAAITRISSNTELERLKSEMHHTIEVDEAYRLGDPASQVSVRSRRSQPAFYIATSDTQRSDDLYSELMPSVSAADVVVHGIPTAIGLAYHRDKIATPIGEAFQFVPSVKLCLAIGVATVHSLHRTGGKLNFEEVLFPFSPANEMLPSLPTQPTDPELR